MHNKPKEIIELPVYHAPQPPPTLYQAPIVASHQESPPQTTHSSIFAHENLQRIINIATIVFATIKIYQRYEEIGITPPIDAQDQSWASTIKQFLASVCPTILYSIGTYGNFLVDSTTIVFEALIYKAIAKLLLLCAHGDITDLVGSVLSGGINTAKQALRYKNLYRICMLGYHKKY